MRKIGKYEVKGLLGRGGMAAVYKVAVPVLGRLAALKLLKPRPVLLMLSGELELYHRFKAEAQIMAGLNHPNLVEVWDYDHDHEDRPFYVMDYYCLHLGLIIGENPRVEEPSRILDLDFVLDLTRQVLQGLGRLHQAGVVHRDIKPANLMLTNEGMVKIGDFGLAKTGQWDLRLPPNLVMGSPFYAAPEQERDPQGVDQRADLYSLGKVVLRLLTGRPGLTSSTRISRLNSDLEPAWDDFFKRALAADPSARFASAGHMLHDLEELAQSWRARKEQACRIETPLPKPHPPRNLNQSLRHKPIKVAPARAREVFGLNWNWRPRGYNSLQFLDKGEDIVVEEGGRLIWQKGGSPFPLTWEQAGQYLDELNNDLWAGRRDWRMPTVDELLSLLTPAPDLRGRCVPPLFDEHQARVWSADRRSFTAAWFVGLDEGYVAWQDLSCRFF